MKRNLFIYAVAVTALLLTSCKYGEDYRTDPLSPSTAPMSAILSANQVGIGYTLGGNLTRFNGYFTQQLTGIGNQQLSISRYIFSQQDTDDSWDSYYRIMASLAEIQTKADAQKSPYYKGIAQILMANVIMQVTDLHGDVPFSDALKAKEDGTGYQSKFDRQQDIYVSIQKLLDDGIVNMNATTSALDPANDNSDLIFKGDRPSWVAFANLMKARAYLHIRLKDGGANAMALTAIGNALMVPSAMDAKVNFPGTGTITQAPLFQFLDQRPGEAGLCKTVWDTLVKYNDPRLYFYADTTGAGPTGLAGIDAVSAGDEGVADAANFAQAGIGTYAGSPNSPTRISMLSEAYFIQAEAAFLSGNTILAASAYNNGVKASLVSVTGGSDAVYEATYASATAATITLKQIMVQKWLALFAHPEGFNDLRRTGFPVLMPANNNATNGLQPNRWAYPQKERTLNAPNIIDEGAAKPILSKVWWAQ